MLLTDWDFHLSLLLYINLPYLTCWLLSNSNMFSSTTCDLGCIGGIYIVVLFWFFFLTMSFMLGNRVFLIIHNVTKLSHRPVERLQFCLKSTGAVGAQLFSTAKSRIGSHTGWRTSTAQVHHPTQARCALLRATVSKDTCYVGNAVTECDNHPTYNCADI